MTTHRANGYFLAFVNSIAERQSTSDRALMASIGKVIQSTIPGSQLRWAGSQHKATAIAGSDLDMCVESRDPVTERQRRMLRDALEKALSRPARVLSHAVRMDRQGGAPKVDIVFANAAFGSRPLPVATEFRNRPARQGAARALKFWTRGGKLPLLPGWALESIVVHLDSPPDLYSPLDLFLRIIAWLEGRATPQAIEAVLRPAAFPRWNPAWSSQVAGRLEALRNQARALGRRKPPPESWQSSDDVERWLRG